MDEKNSINVTSDTPIENAIKNTTRMTGTEEKDKLNNIYDILGNSREWTTEARNIDGRIRRGGYYNDTIAPSNRLNFGPSDNAGSAGSRLALYIK